MTTKRCKYCNRLFYTARSKKSREYCDEKCNKKHLRLKNAQQKLSEGQKAGI